MRVFVIILAIVAILLVAVVAAPFLVPRDWLVAKISDVVGRASGRPFAIDGDVGLSLIPTPRLVAEKIRIGDGDTPLLRLGRLEAVVAAGPLLSGRIEVQRFVLTEPVATLRVDANGVGNWQTRTTPANGDQPPTGGDTSSGSSLPDVALGDVRIEHGVVDYADARSGLAERVEDINLALDAPSLSGPAAVKGDAQVRGEKVDLDLKAAKVGDLLDKMSSPGSVTIGGPVAVSLDGTLSASPAGKLRVEVPDTTKALQWLKVAAPAGAPLPRQLTLTGDLKVDGKNVSLGAVDVANDLLAGKGNFQFDGSGARPKLVGAFNTGVIDVGRFMPKAAPSAPKPATAPTTTPATPSPAPAPTDMPLGIPTSLPIDLDFTLRAAGVNAPQATLGQTQIRTTSGANYVLVQLQEVQAYNGKISGRINSAADAKGIPRLAVKLAASGVQVAPLLKEMLGEERMDGRLALNVDVTGDGRTVNGLLAGLGGKADATLLAATIQGFDLSRLSGDPVQIATVLARDGLRGGSTKIGRASASFTIANGIATTNDISAQAAPIQLTGDGRLNLGERRIEQMRLLPAAMPGQAQGTLGQLPKVPILISGPFNAPDVSVDTDAALQELAKDPKNVQRAIDQVNKLGGNKDKPLIPEKAGKLLEGLLGR